MDFGVVLQCNPPAWRVVDLAKKSELAGFSYVWTFDSHLLWQEPYVIYSQILAADAPRDRRADGDEPGDPRLDGDRVDVRDAQRHVRQPHRVRDRPRRLGGAGDQRQAGDAGRAARVDRRDPRAGQRSRATAYKDSHLQFPWSHGSELPVYVAAYGPKALALAGEVGDGFILQLADLSIAEWSINAVRAAAEAAGRDPASVRICVAAPAYVGDDIAHQRDQVRWFGGMVGNHVADIVERYGADGAAVPQALTDYIKNRQGYDYNEHGRAGNTHTEFVPDEIVDRFCVLGPAQAHIDKLVALKELGVDQFAIYLQHDAQESTLEAYAQTVIPALVEHTRART